MIVNFRFDYGLRGYTLEYAVRILLRRERKNNFIFLSSRFDSIDEILLKYCLNFSSLVQKQIDLLKNGWNHSDIIEFILDNTTNRNIQDIIIYDVKSRLSSAKRSYFEMCISGFNFFKQWTAAKFDAKIISVVLFDTWKFSFNILPFNSTVIHSYSRFKK